MRDDHAVPLSQAAAKSVAAHAARLCCARDSGDDATRRDPLCIVSRGRARAVDPARRDHRVAFASAAVRSRSASAVCPRRRPRRPGCDALALPAWKLQRRGGSQIRAEAVLQTLQDRARHRPIASHLLWRSHLAPRRWTGSTAASSGPAISCSTSARMSVIASPRFAGSARGWWRSNRNPLLAKVLRLLYGRSRDVVIEAVAVGRAAGTIDMMINPDNPTVSTASNEMVSAARDAPGGRRSAGAMRFAFRSRRLIH